MVAGSLFVVTLLYKLYVLHSTDTSATSGINVSFNVVLAQTSLCYNSIWMCEYLLCVNHLWRVLMAKELTKTFCLQRSSVTNLRMELPQPRGIIFHTTCFPEPFTGCLPRLSGNLLCWPCRLIQRVLRDFEWVLRAGVAELWQRVRWSRETKLSDSRKTRWRKIPRCLEVNIQPSACCLGWPSCCIDGGQLVSIFNFHYSSQLGQIHKRSKRRNTEKENCNHKSEC